MFEKKFKCLHCKKTINSLFMYKSANKVYWECEKCCKPIFIVGHYTLTISSDLDIHNRISKIYFHNNKEIRWIEIDENKELVIEYEGE